MADALLTDIDGTLVDSNVLHADAWRRAFEHFGIQIGMDDAWRQIGKGADQLIPAFLPEEDRERIEKPLKEFRKQIFHPICIALCRSPKRTNFLCASATPE
jgi:beta-phosphoglucomutase-like phosphatase (HAD superfamily)